MLIDAIYAPSELAEGRLPDLARAMAGRLELEMMAWRRDDLQDLSDAASALELLVATGGRPNVFIPARTRAWLASIRQPSHPS